MAFASHVRKVAIASSARCYQLNEMSYLHVCFALLHSQLSNVVFRSIVVVVKVELWSFRPFEKNWVAYLTFSRLACLNFLLYHSLSSNCYQVCYCCVCIPQTWISNYLSGNSSSLNVNAAIYKPNPFVQQWNEFCLNELHKWHHLVSAHLRQTNFIPLLNVVAVCYLSFNHPWHHARIGICSRYGFKKYWVLIL